jgi:hypothetical protein
LSNTNLQQLPVDGNVSSRLLNVEYDDERLKDTNADSDDSGDRDNEPIAEESAIPDLLAGDVDIDRIRESVRGVGNARLLMPTVASTLINEFNNTQLLLALAFPTLFLNGVGDFL